MAALNESNFTAEEYSRSGQDNWELCLCFKFIFHGLIIDLVCLCGIRGNIVSLIVLRRDKGNPAAIFLLKALAVVDNFVLIVIFIGFSLFDGLLLKQYATEVWAIRPYMVKYANESTACSPASCNLTTVTIASQ